MKKFVSAALLVAAFTLAASADSPSNPDCGLKGHINMPGLVCQPPQGRAADAVTKSDADDSVLTIIKSFITGFNPFNYLN